jgi:hypothetical protein
VMDTVEVGTIAAVHSLTQVTISRHSHNRQAGRWGIAGISAATRFAVTMDV